MTITHVLHLDMCMYNTSLTLYLFQLEEEAAVIAQARVMG